MIEEHMMIKNISQSRFLNWLQAFTVATVSTVVIGIAFFLLSYGTSSSALIFLPGLALALPGIYLYTWLLGDPFRFVPEAEAAIIWRQVIWLSLLFWFVFGFVSKYVLKHQKYVVGAWCIMVAGCAIWVILFA